MAQKRFGKAEIFRKIEPYLIYLNIHQLERQGADIQTKVEELEDLNQVVVTDCADTALILGKNKPEETKDDVISGMNANITNIRSCGNCFYICMYDIIPREALHDITLMSYALETLFLAEFVV